MSEIVCICGSTKFKKEMLQEAMRLTIAGYIVLMPHVFMHSGDSVTPEDKKQLDGLHRHKIDLAEMIMVVSRDGYIGESTRREIEYAAQEGKLVKFSNYQEIR